MESSKVLSWLLCLASVPGPDTDAEDTQTWRQRSGGLAGAGAEDRQR